VTTYIALYHYHRHDNVPAVHLVSYRLRLNRGSARSEYVTTPMRILPLSTSSSLVRFDTKSLMWLKFGSSSDPEASSTNTTSASPLHTRDNVHNTKQINDNCNTGSMAISLSGTLSHQLHRLSERFVIDLKPNYLAEQKTNSHYQPRDRSSQEGHYIVYCIVLYSVRKKSEGECKERERERK